jgi:hypothetical protein
MKKPVLALAAVLCASLVTLSETARSQLPGQPGSGPFGPGDKGATFKAPWEAGSGAANPPAASPGGSLQGLLNQSTTKGPNVTPTSLLPYQSTGINQDILVTKELGPWMVLVMSYSGSEAPMRARKFVEIARGHYKLPAYVFNYGAAEKVKELERVKKIIEERKAALAKEGLSTDLPIRVKLAHIDEHTAVLIGGFPTSEAAAKYRDQLKTLKPDAKLFKLQEDGDLFDIAFHVPEKGVKEATKAEGVAVNPFTHALVVHNPTLKVERPENKLDVEVLRRFNAEEEYSLLKCKKNYTLVIKQFNLPSVTAPQDSAPGSSFLDSVGAGKKSTANHADYAAENAHELAKALRKAKLEAYVLHTKYYSLVTIGGFESLQDPNMRSMQTLIETRLVPSLEAAQLFPKAMAWEIPR